MANKRFDRQRVDRGELTPQGFLRAPAYFTRVGVFKYRRSDGTTIRELRHPDDVFHPDSLASLQMAPLTDDHPNEFVTPDNVKDLSVGWISEMIKKDAERLIGGTVVVADKNAIARVDRGKVELSCGYLADLVEEKGTFDGEPYDYRQTNIRYNHVAIVDRGRAGPQVRLRLDSADAVVVGEDDPSETERETPDMLKKIKIGDKEFEVSQETHDALTAEFKRRDDALAAEQKAKTDAEDKLKAKTDAASEGESTKVKELTEKNDALQARVDALEEKLAQRKDGASQEEINTAVRERMAIEKAATAVLGSEAKLDSKSNLEIMKDVITKHSPKTDLADKSDVYVRARFDAIAEELDGRDERRLQLGRKIEDSRKEDDFDSESARKRNMDADRELWKQPLASSKK